jgi:hypothetical protein
MCNGFLENFLGDGGVGVTKKVLRLGPSVAPIFPCARRAKHPDTASAGAWLAQNSYITMS